MKSKLTEMPHYQVGDYEKDNQHIHAIDLELEMVTSPEEALDRLLTLVSGGSFISKNGGEFSIPDPFERVEWVESLLYDKTFKMMVERLGIEADAEFFNYLVDTVLTTSNLE